MFLATDCKLQRQREKDSHTHTHTMVRFRGIVHPRAEVPGYDGLKLTRNDMILAAHRLPGTPLHVEHEANRDAIGKVLSADVTDDDQLEIVAEISRKTVEGAKMINRIRSGEIDGLSLGTEHEIFVGRGMTPLVLDKRVTEVSVVKDPALKGTRITEVGPDSEGFLLARKLVEARIEGLKLEKALHIERSLAKGQPLDTGSKDTTMTEKDATTAAAASSSAQAEVPPPPEAVDVKALTEGNQLRQKRQAEQATEDLHEKEVSEKVKIQMAAQHDELLKANAELSAKLDLFKKIKMKPEEAASFLEAEIAKKEKEVGELLATSKDFVSAVYKDAGVKQDDRFLQTLEACKENLITAEPLAKFIAAANTASNNTVTRMEDQYQSLKEKMEVETKRADEYQQRFAEQQKYTGYQSWVSGGAVPPSKEKEAAAQPNLPTGSKTDPVLDLFAARKDAGSDDGVWSQRAPAVGSVMSVAKQFAPQIGAPWTGRGIFRSEREDQQPLIALLREGAKAAAAGGIASVDYKAFVGRDIAGHTDSVLGFEPMPVKMATE